MINPLAAQILPPVSKTSGFSNPVDQAKQPPRSSRSGGEGLASSIMQDGGLGFLRSRLEESMGAIFEKAAEKNPEIESAGLVEFFDASVDVSPEATADRIVGFGLGLKGVYSQQNPEMSEDEMMAGFEAEIRRGISDGFGNARGILGGLDLLNDDVENNVDETWNLIQQKLNDYFHPREEKTDE